MSKPGTSAAVVDAAPHIENIGGKVAVIERRVDYLRREVARATREKKQASDTIERIDRTRRDGHQVSTAEEDRYDDALDDQKRCSNKLAFDEAEVAALEAAIAALRYVERVN